MYIDHVTLFVHRSLVESFKSKFLCNRDTLDQSTNFDTVVP